jgi:hypothetical protein
MPAFKYVTGAINTLHYVKLSTHPAAVFDFDVTAHSALRGSAT